MHHVLDELYFSAVDDDAVARLPATLRRFLGGDTCCMWVFDAATGQPRGTFVTDQPAEPVREYTEHFHTMDPWRAPILTQVGRAVRGGALISDQALAATAYYNDFGRRLGMFHLLAGVVPVGSGSLLAAITTHRAQSQEPFAAADQARLDALLPHLRRAMQMRGLVDRSGGTLADNAVGAMLASIAVPALVCDGHGRVLFANAPAEAMAGRRGFAMAGRGSDIVAQLAGSQASSRFQVLVADAARGGAGGTVPVELGFVVVGPLPGSFAAFGIRPGMVLVAFRIPDETAIASRAATLFGLTPAEAGVAAGVALGLSPDEVADRRGVALGTVRTLLRRALVKTGAANLRQLATMLVQL